MYDPPPRPPRPSWEAFSVAAFRRLVYLMTLLVLTVGVVATSWDAAWRATQISLLVLLAIAAWMFVSWFGKERAQLRRLDELQRDQARDYRLG
ncbi:hypothetical protein BH20ACT5_BH20ACT5_15580 [soil metagenome]